MQRLQPGEIEITSVDDHNGTCGPLNHIEHVDVVHLAGGDMDEHRNGTAEIDDGVGLYGSLGRAKVRPRKQCETEVDRRGVHCIEGLLEPQADVFALIQFHCRRDQAMAESLEQSPVSTLVGIRQGRTRYLAANTDVVELGTLRVEAGHQIAQPFSTGELGIGNAEEMGPGREVPDAVVRRKPIDEVLEMAEGYKLQQLCEDRAATIHDVASFAKETGKDTVKKPLAISNRRNPKSRQNSLHYWASIK